MDCTCSALCSHHDPRNWPMLRDGCQNTNTHANTFSVKGHKINPPKNHARTHTHAHTHTHTQEKIVKSMSKHQHHKQQKSNVLNPGAKAQSFQQALRVAWCHSRCPTPAVVAGGQAEGIAMSKCASAEPQAHAHQRKHMQAQTNAGRQPQASPAAEDVQ